MTAKRRPLLRFLAILPMLVPSITHGLVIVYLFGKMGIVTRLTGIQLPIYGPLGIVMGSFFYAFPLAFLVLSQALINLDGRLFETAAMLGVRPLRRFFDITLPIMKYALFSAFAVCFTMIFTDYGIPLSVGGTYSIIPLLFYKNVIGMLDFSKGAIYSTMILVPAVIVYLLDILYFSKKQVSSTRNVVQVRSGRFHPVQKLFFAMLLVMLVVPIALILITPFIQSWPYDMTLTFSHFARIITVGKLGSLILNSVLIALMTGVLGTLLSLAAGYMYVRVASAPSGAQKTGPRPLHHLACHPRPGTGPCLCHVLPGHPHLQHHLDPCHRQRHALFRLSLHDGHQPFQAAQPQPGGRVLHAGRQLPARAA